jgi:hypothetical protein
MTVINTRMTVSNTRMTDSNFQTENPQILAATVQNLIAMATGATGFVYPCFINRINKVFELQRLHKFV